jgi:hypothetical protein
VLAIREPGGAYVEAVPFSNGNATTQASRDSLAFIQAQGLWMPADCGGAPCDDMSMPTAQAVSASWSGVGNTPGGNSARRIGATNDTTSWAVGASSFGQTN